MPRLRISVRLAFALAGTIGSGLRTLLLALTSITPSSDRFGEIRGHSKVGA